MRTAIDSSVLWLIFNQHPGWESWEAALEHAATEGTLAVNPITFAECSQGFPSWGDALDTFQSLQIQYDPIGPDAAFLAGKIFQTYRRKKGPREHLLPDFLIAAHAHCQADRFAALDRGYVRTYFPDLTLLTTSF